MRKTGADFRDVRHGAYDPVSKDGLPQPEQVTDQTNAHQAAQGGADVRAKALPGIRAILPEGLTKPRMGPLSPKRGRREA
jgi:hypothetical protein